MVPSFKNTALVVYAHFVTIDVRCLSINCWVMERRGPRFRGGKMA